MTSRRTGSLGVTEQFSYDALYRLTQSQLVGLPSGVSGGYNTDPFSNLTWGYPAAGNPQPHAVTSLVGGTTNTSFTPHGEPVEPRPLLRLARVPRAAQEAMRPRASAAPSPGPPTTGPRPSPRAAPRSPSRTTPSTSASSRPPPRAPRSTCATPAAGSWWSSSPAPSCSGRVPGGGGPGGGRALRAQRRHRPGAVFPWFDRLTTGDHLGSICALTDETGTVVQRIAYDAWGRQRYETGATDPTNSITSQTTKSFTGEERLADVNLVHLNARVYDPIVQKFLSADGMVESPFSTQGWNRYAYVGNNPLTFTDPSGQCFLGCFWKGFFHAIGSLLRNPIVQDILKIAAVAACGGDPVCGVAVAFASSAFIAGVTSGKLGLALKAGLIAAATAIANIGIGDLTTPVTTTQLVPSGFDGVADAVSVTGPSAVGGISTGFGSLNYFAGIALHAALGCATNELSSGRGCGPGALAGGISAASGPITPSNFGAGLVFRSTLGGLASVAGGGKFASGALTAAFDYLLNDWTHGRGHIGDDGAPSIYEWSGPRVLWSGSDMASQLAEEYASYIGGITLQDTLEGQALQSIVDRTGQTDETRALAAQLSHDFAAAGYYLGSEFFAVVDGSAFRGAESFMVSEEVQALEKLGGAVEGYFLFNAPGQLTLGMGSQAFFNSIMRGRSRDMR